MLMSAAITPTPDYLSTMNVSIRIPLPVLLAIVVAVVALVFALGAKDVSGVSGSQSGADSWSIATAQGGVYVLNQRTGNLYFLPEPATSIGNKNKLKLITNVSAAK